MAGSRFVLQNIEPLSSFVQFCGGKLYGTCSVNAAERVEIVFNDTELGNTLAELFATYLSENDINFIRE